MLQVFDTAEQELAATGQPSSSRGCKYALNTLMQTFQLKAMAANVAAGPVQALQVACTSFAISACAGLQRLLDTDARFCNAH